MRSWGCSARTAPARPRSSGSSPLPAPVVRNGPHSRARRRGRRVGGAGPSGLRPRGRPALWLDERLGISRLHGQAQGARRPGGCGIGRGRHRAPWPRRRAARPHRKALARVPPARRRRPGPPGRSRPAILDEPPAGSTAPIIEMRDHIGRWQEAHGARHPILGEIRRVADRVAILLGAGCSACTLGAGARVSASGCVCAARTVRASASPGYRACSVSVGRLPGGDVATCFVVPGGTRGGSAGGPSSRRFRPARHGPVMSIWRSLLGLRAATQARARGASARFS